MNDTSESSETLQLGYSRGQTYVLTVKPALAICQQYMCIRLSIRKALALQSFFKKI